MRYMLSFAAAVFALFAVAWVAWCCCQKNKHVKGLGGNGGKCGNRNACGAQDPVSDPDYNMKEIAKQSILLEEHLAEKNKRCKDCIAKHFMHIIGLAEESQCLAGSKLSKYPLMDSNPAFYNRLFKRWLNDKEGDENQRLIEDELRGRRKKLIEIYVLGVWDMRL